VGAVVEERVGTALSEHGGVTTLGSLEDAVPPVPAGLLEPVWSPFAALLADRPAVDPTQPRGCHRRRIADRVVLEYVVAALVQGCGDARLATPGCSDRTIRRRVHEWAAAGLTETLHTLALPQHERMIGIAVEDLAVDGCITTAPGGGEKAGRSPVDRGKQGVQRATVTAAAAIPLPAGVRRRPPPGRAPPCADRGGSGATGSVGAGQHGPSGPGL
jgi:hypothetical protein